MNDGQQTLSSTLPGACSTVQVSTDAAGQIIAPWLVAANPTCATYPYTNILTVDNLSTQIYDEGILTEPDGNNPNTPYNNALSQNSPGTPGIWTFGQGFPVWHSHSRIA